MLLDFLKAKLTPEGGGKALADLEQAPDDADNQADLRKRLKQVLAADPDFRKELADRLAEVPAVGKTVNQTADVKGNQNVINQIAGSNNRVGGVTYAAPPPRPRGKG